MIGLPRGPESGSEESQPMGRTTSDLATKAAREALDQADLDPEDIELIIVATITPDTLTPATACYVQEQLGAEEAVAFRCFGSLFRIPLRHGTGEMPDLCRWKKERPHHRGGKTQCLCQLVGP